MGTGGKSHDWRAGLQLLAKLIGRQKEPRQAQPMPARPPGNGAPIAKIQPARIEVAAVTKAPAAPALPPPRKLASPARTSKLKRKGRSTAAVPRVRGEPVDFGELRKPSAPVRPVSQSEAPRSGASAISYVREHVPAHEIRVRPGPPLKASTTTTAQAVRTIEAGASILHARPEPHELGFIVGFDFGTSSSKIVIHQQGAGDLAYALPVPKELRVSEDGRLQEHLWRSTVWFNPSTQRFSLTPLPEATAIEGFKTGLINTHGHRMVIPGVTHAQASAAYLAMLVAYVLGQHRQDPPPGFDRKQHYGRFHFGVPVACKEVPGCADSFLRVLGAVFELAPHAGDLSLEVVKAALASATPVQNVGADTPFVVFEELAAVIAGYRASPDARFGPHMVVDVGASTLDVATFHIPEGDNAIPVYMSGVELLGADALSAARQANIPDPTFRAACAEHTKHVLSTTFRYKNPSFLPQNGVTKPLLFVGGGRLTELHSELYGCYQQGFDAPLRTPQPGRNLKCEKTTDFARLLLAWGLSQEEIELPRLKPPSQVESEVRSPRDYTTRYVDKDMV